MTATGSLDLIRTAAAAGLVLAASAFAAPALAQQSAPERGVFVTQIGDGSRAEVTQQNADGLARVVQDGNDNRVTLNQKGTAPHRAQIVQDGDNNLARAEQDGDGQTELAIGQDGSGNSALVFQRDTAASNQSLAAILQRGNDNSVVLVQDGSDNQASLTQLGNGNAMTATQLDSGNRLLWTQNGDGLADLQITQSGGANLQITQSNTGAQFAPPPGSGG
ncbi:hypothetical protein [Erythrobacter colymbi]|uniref:hypothetical protein n=1 Tax=Erythrobacter colymbi TaxID=1161202 RepID=UPI000A35EA21|nr:hypothetical protein [Erythrobacter colymbi]